MENMGGRHAGGAESGQDEAAGREDAEHDGEAVDALALAGRPGMVATAHLLGAEAHDVAAAWDTVDAVAEEQDKRGGRLDIADMLEDNRMGSGGAAAWYEVCSYRPAASVHSAIAASEKHND